MCITFWSLCIRKLFAFHFQSSLPTVWEGVTARTSVLDTNMEAMCRVWQKQTTSLVMLPLAVLYTRAINSVWFKSPYFWFFDCITFVNNLRVGQRCAYILILLPLRGGGLRPFLFTMRRFVTAMANFWVHTLRNWQLILSVFMNTIFENPELSWKKSDSLRPPCREAVCGLSQLSRYPFKVPDVWKLPSQTH